jgi:hypothetical protein
MQGSSAYSSKNIAVQGKFTCGISNARRFLRTTLPEDMRLYVNECQRLLGDPTKLDVRGGSCGTDASSYRLSPLQGCEVAHPRFRDMRLLLVAQLQLFRCLVSGVDQVHAAASDSKSDERTSVKVMEDIGRINDITDALTALLHDLILPLDMLPVYILRCPIIVEIFYATSQIFETVVDAASCAATRILLLAETKTANEQAKRWPLPRTATELSDILSAKTKAIVVDFLKFLSASNVVKACALVRLGQDGRGYSPMADHSILSQWEDCDMHKFWCRTIVIFASVARFCRLSPGNLARIRSKTAESVTRTSLNGDLLLWPEFAKISYQFSLAHADVLNSVLPVLIYEKFRMSLRTFSEVDATLVLFYELYTRERFRSWILCLKARPYEDLEIQQAKVLASIYKCIHRLVALLSNHDMRWQKACAFNKHERRSKIKNKILREWKFLRYYLAIIVHLFPAIKQDSSNTSADSLFNSSAPTGNMGKINSNNPQLRAANGFDRIIIDAIYKALAKLLSIVCPELQKN